jgi:hypothetical protein
MKKQKRIFPGIFVPLIMVFLSCQVFNSPGLFSQESKPKTGIDFFREAQQAYQKKMYPAYLENLTRAYRLIPGYTPIMYYLAAAHSLNGNKSEALKWLKKAAELGMNFPVQENHDFDSLKDSAEFKALVKKFSANQAPTNNSKIAFTIPEKDLIPEGITYNSKTGTFYVTSIYKRKIISINREGKIVDFISEKQDGFWGGVGMKVDISNQILWANSGSGQQMKDFQKEGYGLTGTWKYDLTTKKLIKKYIAPHDTRHLFNDLVLRSNGDVFVTDTESGAVYMISAKKDELEQFIPAGEFLYPNGITISHDQAFLFVAHLQGISRIHINTKKIHLLSHPKNVSVNSIDGLYFYRGSLVAIQNGGGLNRVVRFFLNKSLDGVEQLKILEANHPLFIIPTTGVCVGEEFYYIANSQLRSYNEDHTIFPLDKLKEVVILKTNLVP